MSIKIDFGLIRLDKIINELELQIKFLEIQKEQLKNKRRELATCEELLN